MAIVTESELAGLRAAILEATTYGEADGYRERSLILADACEEAGDQASAERWRRKARWRRSPGVRWPQPGLLPGLSAHQADELRAATARPLGLLTGTPGTGKTYTAAAVIRAVIEQHGERAVAVCSPTGKAAVRITEALARYGAPVRAKTIHSTLGIGRNGHDGDGWGFRRNRGNPLDEAFVFVDEASMLDTDLAASLFDACRAGTHILLIGDPHQLPPVGHGAPLRDLIAAGVPCGRLSEIRRNAGLIVRGCAAIKDGQPFVCVQHTQGDHAGDNLAVIEADVDAQSPALLDLIDRLGERFDPVWDVQVIVATNRSGPLARRAINLALQGRLNPDGLQLDGNPFRLGDKVICLKNGWYRRGNPDGADDEAYVANGEQGEVTGVFPGRVLLEFDGPARLVQIPIGRRRDDSDDDDGGGTGCDFDLGYAITCHKSQGSEWPVVVVVIDPSPGARQICTREWIYTAISRASQLCVLVGREGVAQQMACRQSLHRRKTFLRELLTGRLPGEGRRA